MSRCIVPRLCWAFALLPTVAALAQAGGDEVDWTKAAPPEVRRLLEAGGVTVRFYPPAAEPPDLTGRATFGLALRSPYEYEYEWRRAHREVVTQIQPRFQPSMNKLQHDVLLPARLNRPEAWNDALVRHELDHVAIASDPRVLLLYDRLVARLTRLERRAAGREPPTEEQIRQTIEDALKARREAIYELIRANNRQLDRLTRHGAEPLADREAFFRGLYLKESLDAAKFPYLADVIDLLETDDYRRAATVQLP